MPYNERSPLISFHDDDDDFSFTQRIFTIICFVIALMVVVLIFITPHDVICHDYPNDVSTIPNQYMLSHKSFWHFGYLIETYPVEFNDDEQQSEYILLAEIVSESSSWSDGKYEILEFRKNNTSNEPFPVKTADSILSFLMNDVHISFKKNNNNNYTHFIRPELCDYKITWDWTFNGRLYRKCEFANETLYSFISYIRGSTAWGLSFFSDDGLTIYAKTFATQYWWNMHRRDIVVEPFAPFPPLIPAIYTAYYDTIQRNRENNKHTNQHVINTT